MNVRDLVPWLSDSVIHRGDPFSLLHSHINSLFADAYSAPRGSGTPSHTFADFAPRVNVTESDQAFTVTAELPGIGEKDVNVSFKERVLTFSGERKNSAESKAGAEPSYTESSFGTFRRALRLGAEIDEEKITASIKNGLLTVVLPKSTEDRMAGRTISIQSE